jgi:hypothetical protein
MNKKAPLEAPISVGQQIQPWAGDRLPDVVAIRRFQVNDVVRIIAGDSKEYIVLSHRDYEPCCQILRNDGSPRKEWMISEELELVAGPVNNGPAGLPADETSAPLLPRTLIS